MTNVCQWQFLLSESFQSSEQDRPMTVYKLECVKFREIKKRSDLGLRHLTSSYKRLCHRYLKATKKYTVIINKTTKCIVLRCSV